jgi:hypothetical protein
MSTARDEDNDFAMCEDWLEIDARKVGAAYKFAGVAKHYILELRLERERRGRMEAELAEMKTLKLAFEQTPKQWSTAQAPTMEAMIHTARGFMARTANERLRNLLRRIIDTDCVRSEDENLHDEVVAALASLADGTGGVK